MTKKIAFIFPGQGSQYVGMGQSLIEENQLAKEVIKQANNILGFDLGHLCIKGPADKLNNTQNTQPAIFTISYIANLLLNEKGIEPSIVAGHSLGEYSALTAAKVISFEEGLKMVRKRGLLMNKALPTGEGSMAAIIGLDGKKINSICMQVKGICEVANYNSPQQIVISGENQAIKDAMNLAKENGAKRAIELNVSGPFHSSLMKTVQEKFQNDINNITINAPAIPIVGNASADYLKNCQAIKNELLIQLTNSIHWVKSMELIINRNINTFIEVGPGKVLRGLMRRINRKVRVYNVQDMKTLDKVIDKL